MPFTGIVHPEELNSLTETLETFCQAEGIQPGTPEYDDVARMIMDLLSVGGVSADEINDALMSRRKRARVA
jgi:hypothetical protein